MSSELKRPSESTTETESSNKKQIMSSTSTIYPATSFLIQRLSEKAKIPTRGSALAAGYDLYR